MQGVNVVLIKRNDPGVVFNSLLVDSLLCVAVSTVVEGLNIACGPKLYFQSVVLDSLLELLKLPVD